jgi:hypothetical protein
VLAPCRKNRYARVKEKDMSYKETMSLHEKLALGVKSIELEKQGKFEEARRVLRSTPLQPYLAKFYKDYIGVDALLKSGWNLSEAEAEYGPDWLTR